MSLKNKVFESENNMQPMQILYFGEKILSLRSNLEADGSFFIFKMGDMQMFWSSNKKQIFPKKSLKIVYISLHCRLNIAEFIISLK